jgi:biotin transport system substrate-specific component|tara:strand:+ start:2318 stop:3130 length:813 start_codon:yes stop_codon:yes gene_type:complete
MTRIAEIQPTLLSVVWPGKNISISTRHIVELLFLALLVLSMRGALVAGFPEKIILPGLAILSIGLASISGLIFTGNLSSYISQILRTISLALLGSLFIALVAQIQVPLWPVPITGQTFGVLVVGLAFGCRLGALTLILYLCEGLIGLPVFSGDKSGYSTLVGPTGGYIVGFIFAAAITGYFAEKKWDRNVWYTGLAMLLGNLAIYIPGLIWLTIFFEGPGSQYVAVIGASTAIGAALTKGLLPFIIGDILKLALAAIIFPYVWRFVPRFK